MTTMNTAQNSFTNYTLTMTKNGDTRIPPTRRKPESIVASDEWKSSRGAGRRG
jgi:hypothetical protein